MYRPFWVKLAVVLALGFCVLVPVGKAFAGPFGTPERGSPERKAIMNALRAPVQKDLGQPVIFVVDKLKVGLGWAFLVGNPVQPSGKRINFQNTGYAEAIEMGIFDEGIFALLHNSGSGWVVVEFVIGPTDAPWFAWPEEYGAPWALFK